MKSAKKRNVDYTLDEMANKAGISRKAFVDRLKRVCEIYNFNLGEFKEIPDELDSNYFFPPEISDYILLLVKNIDKHPLYARNARQDKISAAQIADFNRSLLTDIDEIVSTPVKEILYNRLAHMVAERVAYWSKPLVKQLTRFLINNVTLKTEDVGAAMSLFTKELDKMSFCLFQADFLKNYLVQVNNETTGYDELSDEVKQFDAIINGMNVSFDTILATIIRGEFIRIADIRKEKFQSAIDRIDVCHAAHRFMGDPDVKGAEAIAKILDLGSCPGEDEEREIYRDYFVKDDICTAMFTKNNYLISHVRKKQAEWGPMEKVIDPDNKKSEEELVSKIEEQIDTYERKIQDLKQMQQALLSMTSSEKSTLLSGYLEHCKSIDKEYKHLQEVTDLYIGQALYEFLK